MPLSHRPPALILAAGGSRRLGRSKQLVTLDGETLVHRAARIALTVTDTCIVVCGADRARVTGALGELSVRPVFNPQWRSGMGSSLACGVAALPADARAVLVMSCDQYRIGSASLGALIHAWQDGRDRIVAAGYAGVEGIPAVFPSRCFPELGALSGDRGARDMLRSDTGRITVDLPEAETDLDHPEDLDGRLRTPP